MTTKKKASFIYTTTILFVMGWWSLWLYQPSFKQTSQVTVATFPEREELKQALQGDFPLMAKLIREWNAASFQLTSQELLLCSLISKELENDQSDLLTSYVVDDHGQRLSTNCHSLLPQTYMAATILFALCPENIVAFPTGFRSQEHLFPKSLLATIPDDLDTFFAEKISKMPPEMAFVANYSNPTTIETLKEHRVPLYTTVWTQTPDEISNTILNMGHIAGKPLQAQLLSLFLKAAMLHIDHTLKDHFSTHTYPKLLLANNHRSLSLPDRDTLQDILLTRLQINSDQPKGIALTKEKIQQINPDCLVLCTHTTPLVKATIEQDPFFHQITYAFIEDEILNSPTQFFILAYFDLAQILMEHS